ncbi:MAG: glycosyltransferase [Deltaproteobacteria bacterium]|nr:glycosyltransferase [Deltaproteobacteria bacterium]
MESLSILVVTDAWKWFAEAEQLALACEVLAARGHRIEVACQPESPVRARLSGVARRFHDLPGLRGPASPLEPLRNVGRLRRVLREGAFDLVHAYRSPPHGLALTALRGWGRRRPGLVRTRGGAQPITGGAANRMIYQGLTDAVLATSTTIREDLIRLGLAPDAVTLLPNVVSTDRLAGADGAAFRREVRLPAEGPVVGVLGRFAKVKGHRYLVEALPRLLEVHRDLRVCLVGPEADGAEVEALARAEALGVRDHVVLVGERDDPGSVLAALDVVAVPSVGSEVIARVPLEAMALGRPVVASRVGVLPEIIREPESGWLVPPADPKALAHAVLEALDPQEGRRRGAAARRQVESQHLPEHLGEALEAAYSRVLASRDPRRSSSSLVE